ELTTSKAGVSPVEVVEPGEGESAQNLRRLPASTLTSTLGARFVFVPNLGDQPLQVPSPLPATVLPHRVAVLSFDVDFASRGAPVKLVSSNAEICRLHKTDRALISVVAPLTPYRLRNPSNLLPRSQTARQTAARGTLPRRPSSSCWRRRRGPAS